MYIFDSLKRVLAGYADFRGQTNPVDFYFGLVWLFMIQVAYQLVRGTIFNADGANADAAYANQLTVQLILNFLLYLPLIAIVARRLNDMGRSVWLMLPIAISVMASNLNSAYGVWINPAYGKHVTEQDGSWFSSFGAVALLATLVCWLFTVVITVRWRTPKPQVSAAFTEH